MTLKPLVFKNVFKFYEGIIIISVSINNHTNRQGPVTGKGI